MGGPPDLVLHHGLASQGLHIPAMANFVFTCPATNFKVQHQLDDDPHPSDTKYAVIVCPACARLHFRNRKTSS
jgi:hypothetical protein